MSNSVCQDLNSRCSIKKDLNWIVKLMKRVICAYYRDIKGLIQNCDIDADNSTCLMNMNKVNTLPNTDVSYNRHKVATNP